LKKVIRNKIKDKELLWLLDNIIDSAPGIPIGNYLSQYFANLYLSKFDHWVKEILKIKYYFRYCDDLVILSDSKEKLHVIFKKINDYFINILKLTIKKNYKIFPTTTGIDFLGYKFYSKYTLIRKRIKNNCFKKLKSRNIKKLQKSMSGYYGWFIHCNSHNLRTKINNILYYKRRIEYENR
jgi:hypothetical protein